MRVTPARDQDRIPQLLRGAATVSIALVASTWLSALYGVVEIVGGTFTFVVAVGAAVALAYFLGSTLTHREAVIVGAGLLALGLGGYLNSVPPSYWAVMSPSRAVADMVALLTGYSVIKMTNAGVWAIAVAPAPAFLVTYFAVQREYVRSATVSALTLGFFVLTGDSTSLATLLGVVGATGALGFTALARHGGSRDQLETLAAALAVMILASATVTAVPGGTSAPLLAQDSASVQADLVRAGDRSNIGGSIRLSPKVQFVVESEEPAYWRAAAYDRYTGSGWIRTGESRPLDGARGPPPGDRRRIEQTFTAKRTLDVLVAAPWPRDVDGVDVAVTAQDTIDLTESLSPGESYSVVSLRPNVTAAQLRQAGTDYPEGVRERYTQLPETTSDRVKRLTDNLTAGADSAYEKAKTIERWLENTKNYSTSVPRPSGGVAESFLFEMDEGYCVYFATTMVAMLRTQGIPARYVVGYTPGQRVANDTWVVRGYDSHAWVEVYFPDHGWVRFDPTPGGPRSSAESEELEEAREGGAEGIDAAGSEDGTWTPTPDPTVGNGTGGNVSGPGTGFGPLNPYGLSNVTTPGQFDGGGNFSVNGTVTVAPPTSTLPRDPDQLAPGGDGGGGGGLGLPVPGGVSLPPMDVLALWSVLFAGLAAGARRTGVTTRVYRAVWLRWQPRTDDAQAAVEGAFDRVEHLLGRQYREREDGETVREYLAAVDADERVRTVADIRERVRYAGDVDEGAVEEARRLAAAYVSDRAGVATTFNRLLS